MAKETNGLFSVPVKGHQEAMALLKELTAIAQPGAVYGEPVSVDEHTVITASEVSVGLGFGYGMGAGTEPGSAEMEENQDAPTQAQDRESAESGFGGGGGGGGASSARPVAVIHIGPEGVQVEPVVDATKIALAFFTMLGSIFMLGAKMRKKAKRL
jgi:uncharacterized spore protein YtfJ